ncbi:MAG: hypothetical protein K2X77_01330 [Candidatus Obscuribacterales bacterium]|nr:hypothetical protein [Candidatus Obscuribacterales bacterium]
MKTKSAIWNSFLSAMFCALLALLAIVPKANCCCAPIMDSHNDNIVSESHDCCKQSVESNDSKATVAGNHIHMDGACACSVPFIAVSDKQWSNLSADSKAIQADGAAITAKHVLCLKDVQVAIAEENFNLIALHNDELKPSKIYLLNRALLN